MADLALIRIDDVRVKIPRTGGMLVDGMIFADEELLENFVEPEAITQVANVAHLPGIVAYSFGMPDIHWGYGFPIGGVAGMDVDKRGVISPGGVGFDINCGVRLIRSNLELDEVLPRLDQLLSRLYARIPAGLGRDGGLSLSKKELKRVLSQGSRWLVTHGMGEEADLVHCEEGGCMPDADPEEVSRRAYERGVPQLGSLGSGNHFLEIQVVEEVYDEAVAQAFGVFKGQITVMIHCGSRGLGHQICSDFVKIMLSAMSKYGISVPDRQLVCAPFYSEEGQRYWRAMCCAANYAWANRQMITHMVREAFEVVFGGAWRSLGLDLIYDVAHNIAKLERHHVDGKWRTLCVHRKGATRSFGPERQEVPERYREVGQPVLIPGDMGRSSYLLVGRKESLDRSLGSTCHGAGRCKSRNQATKEISYSRLLKELEDRGIKVYSHSKRTLVEEAPEAYKDVSMVVEVAEVAGLSKKVARMRPLGVIKG